MFHDRMIDEKSTEIEGIYENVRYLSHFEK